jgi:hypothetical protein
MMNVATQVKLERLQADYVQVHGRPFVHFFCPVLFRDEDVSLCQAHIVNQAFPGSAKNWTIQREDVDNFYGSAFESDFLAIKYQEGLTPDEVLGNRELSREFRPRILLDGEPISHYLSDGPVPNTFTEVKFSHSSGTVQLALKMHPDDTLAATNKDWQIEINRDVRLAALVSLIKAAHLTLFEMLGYRYALSAGGYFVGKDILGQFFLNNCGLSKRKIIENATAHFQEFVHMVRPIQSQVSGLQGTLADRQMFICGNPKSPWALIVFVKTSQSLHAVLIPMMGTPETAHRFISFIKNGNEQIEAVLCRFENEEWHPQQSITLTWPKTGTLYP